MNIATLRLKTLGPFESRLNTALGSVGGPLVARSCSLAISTVASLAVTAQLASKLDNTEFAISGLLLGFALFHPILEAGTAPVFVNETAALAAQGRHTVDASSHEVANMRTASRTLLLMVVVVTVCATVASAGDLWPALLGIRESAAGLGCAAFVTSVALAVNVFAGAGAAVLAGVGRQWIVSLLPGASSLLSFALVTLAPWPSTTGVLPVIAVPLSGMIVNVGTLIWVKSRLGLPFRTIHELWDRATYPGGRIRSLMAPAFALTLFGAVFFASDRYLLIRAGCEADLPLFIAASQIYMAMIALLVAASNGLWAWTQQARARGNRPGPLSAFKVATGFFVLACGLAIVLYGSAPVVLPIILGRRDLDWQGLTLALSLLLAVYGPLIGLESLLKERRGFRIRALAWPLALATKFSSAMFLAQAWGSAGVVASGTFALIPLVGIELWAAIRLGRDQERTVCP